MDNRYTLPDLPYDYAALEPHYSAEILELHHDKHHAAYVEGANTRSRSSARRATNGDFGSINQLEKNLAFHLSGHVLHSLFWQNMSPDGGGEPGGRARRRDRRAFGSFDAFKASSPRPRSTCRARAGARSRGSRSASG